MDPQEYEALIEKAVAILDQDDCDSEDDDPRAATCVTGRSYDGNGEMMDILVQLVKGNAMYNAIDKGPRAVEQFIDIFDKARFHTAWHHSYEEGLDAKEDHFLIYALDKAEPYPEAVILIGHYWKKEIVHEVMDEIIRYSSVDTHTRLLSTCIHVMGPDVFVEKMQGDYLACPIRSFMFRSYEPAMDVLESEFGLDLCLKLASPPGPVSGSLLDNLITPIGALYPGMADDMRALKEFIEFLERHEDHINAWNIFVYRSREGEDVFRGGFLYKMLKKTRKRAAGGIDDVPVVPTDDEYTEVMTVINRVLSFCQNEPHLCDKLVMGTKDTGASALQVAVDMSAVYAQDFNVRVNDIVWYRDRFYEPVNILLTYLTYEGLTDSLTKKTNSLLVRGETIMHLAAQQPSDGAMSAIFDFTDEDLLSEALDVRKDGGSKPTPFLMALQTSSAVTTYMANSSKISNQQLNAVILDISVETGAEPTVEVALRRDEEMPGPGRFMATQATRELLLNNRFRERAVKSARM